MLDRTSARAMNALAPRSSIVSGRRGFTFVEVIVAVALLGVVIAMLLPALARARRQSHTITCLSNLRQIDLAFDAYTNHDLNNAFAFDPAYGAFWTRLLKPLIRDSSDVLLCPEANERSFGWGSASQSWGPYDAARGADASMAFLGDITSGYGFNGWLYTAADFSRPWHMWHHRLGNSMPVFGDANWIDAFPRADDAIPADLTHGANSDQPQLGRFCLARHDGGTNLVFLDGHAEQRDPQTLSQCRWQRPALRRTSQEETVR